MPESILIRRLLLPELHLVQATQRPGTKTLVVHARKQSEMRAATTLTSLTDTWLSPICPKSSPCAEPSSAGATKSLPTSTPA